MTEKQKTTRLLTGLVSPWFPEDKTSSCDELIYLERDWLRVQRCYRKLADLTENPRTENSRCV